MAKKEGFFKKILDFFVSSDNPEAIKRKRLKEIAKKIGKTRYSKWYKSSTQEILPSAAQFFYAIYKVVGPARPLLAGAVRSETLKTVTVENSLSQKQVELLEKLSEEEIIKRGASTKAEDLASQVNQELKLFIGEFDALQAEKIDENYKNLDGFINFVLFDYYFLLRKFDSNIIENNFTYKPNFQAIRGEYIIEELKDFAVALSNLTISSDWKELFQIIKIYKNIQPVHEGQWKKLVSALNDLKKSKVLDDIIRHSSSDILYKVEDIPFSEKVTDSYIENMRKTTKNTVNKIVKAQTSKKAAVLLNRIFGEKIPYKMKNYSVERHQLFLKKGLNGFVYVEEMSYLKSFLIEYVKTDIRGLCDLFLVRGDWGGYTELTSDYSDSFHAIMQISAKVIEFDEKLSEVSDIGVRFRTLMSRMDREKEARRQLIKLLDNVNKEAFEIMKFFIKHIIVIANNLKNILADYDKPRRELLQNWKEIEHNAEKPVREWMVDSYKKIYDFILLLQLFQKKNK